VVVSAWCWSRARCQTWPRCCWHCRGSEAAAMAAWLLLLLLLWYGRQTQHGLESALLKQGELLYVRG
jgi:hypothetical protein